MGGGGVGILALLLLNAGSRSGTGAAVGSSGVETVGSNCVVREDIIAKRNYKEVTLGNIQG